VGPKLQLMTQAAPSVVLSTSQQTRFAC